MLVEEVVDDEIVDEVVVPATAEDVLVVARDIRALLCMLHRTQVSLALYPGAQVVN